MAEKEYIEREAMNNVLDELTVNDSLYNALQAIPAADVVEVVRCKDCINFEQGIIGWCNEFERGIYCDDFCSYGERKEFDNG